MKSKIFIALGILLISAGLVFAFLQKNRQVQISTAQNRSTSPSHIVKINCSGIATISETEGPYYKAGSPERKNFYTRNIPGAKFTLTGYVVDTNCKPIAHAWLDFWQADGNGHYDNAGYILRGHQYTDANGKFMLVTVVPGEYPGRTPHIHVKVRVSDTSQVITTQLYIPGLATNANDSIYNPTLQMQHVTTTKDGKSATFTFIIQR
jgi:protocatechuate 3,4-dioxygenase beta subunit